MKYLIYDLSTTGHHSEYINHLVNYISNNTDENIYYFIVNTDFTLKFPEISSRAKSTKNITWNEVSKNELVKTLSNSLFIRSFTNYELLNKYAIEYDVDHVLLLYFNTFQLSLIFKRTKYSIDGILFRQFYRMNTNTIKKKLKYFVKLMLIKGITKNKKIRNIFVLNDEKTVKYLNTKIDTNVFKILNDPVPVLTPKENFSISEFHDLEENRIILLHFGSMSDRKGTLDILDSLSYLDNSILKKISVLLIGKADERIKKNIEKKINILELNNSFISIIFRNEFVSDEEMKSYFEQSDYLLIPYKNIESSSGILGHAISTGTPVLSVKKGLIEDIISNYSTGVLIDEVSPLAIKSGIEELISKDFVSKNRNYYIKTHNPKIFGETLLNKSQDE